MKNILEYLERTQRLYPDHIAVDDGKLILTWKELAELSRKIGTTFSKRVNPGEPIAILAEKSSVTLAAMLGTVYAGCFYVLIDPSQPQRRRQEILNILETNLLVVNDRTEDVLWQTEYKGVVCRLRSAMQTQEDEERLRKIREESRDTDILYGIFTSGSTGTPKGIVVSHRAAMDFIRHFVLTFGFDTSDRIGNQAPFDFDISVKDIYTSIYTGATLILIPKEMFSAPPVLLDYLCEKKVTTLIWAVSALSLVAALKGLSYKVPLTVRKILFSGEVMPVKLLRIWQEALPQAEFVNLYGPTEITCNCTFYRVPKVLSDGEKLPIGKAFSGREVILMNEDGQEIAECENSGEICVLGESLSEGYYHNPEETKRRFIVVKRDGREEERCYKTGDLGYYGKNGELYFSGRKDFQIKHMGHRIELEEIECAMEQIDGLERGICVMDTKRNRLIAFYLGEVTPGRIKEEMKKKLPSYMIPHKLIKTDFMPLNKNGKTDRLYFRGKVG